ncbi:MAG: xanthine dehydrogenase family protein molybdopterin-binding subunit [Thermodesulfobacteriota bacterium]
MESYRFMGKSFPWYDAREKALGKAIYAADIKLPGMLYGKLLRSPLPHARIVNLDISRATRLLGRDAIITAAELPNIRFGNFSNLVKDRTLLARDKVRHVGEPVAAVAAADESLAAEALELIKVEYEELPAIFDAQEAMKPEARLIHERIDSYQAAPGIIKYGNVCSFSRVKGGDLDNGWKKSERIFQDTFHTQMIHQGYIELVAAVASPDISGRTTLFSPIQTPSSHYAHLCQILDLPPEKLRFVPTKIGGSFGGKSTMDIDPFAVLLAQRTSKPVKIVIGREEEFISTGSRHPCTITLKTGVMKDGTLTAREARLIFDTGAYADFGPGVASEASQQVHGPYRIPHYKLDGYAVYTNKPGAGCCRAHGAPQPTFASESQMNIIAAELGIDPLELRLKNALTDGCRDVIGRPQNNLRLVDMLAAAKRWVNEKQQKPRPNRGIGLACGTWHTGGRASSATIKLNADGSVRLLVGTVDVSGSHVVLAQILAEELGISPEDVVIPDMDTDFSPYDAGSSGSRVICNLGNAVKAAASQARARLFDLAADKLEANPADLVTGDGCVQVKGSPEKRVSISELAAASYKHPDGPILVSGSACVSSPKHDPDKTEGLVFVSYNDMAFVIHALELEVDDKTGAIKIVDFAAFHDIGTALNPLGVEGQAQGGAIQALGFALDEEIIFSQGKPLNASFKDYRIPKAVESPRVATFLIEDNAGDGPYGAKGLGELPAIPTAPAVANALYDALKVRIKDLPLRAEKILTALNRSKLPTHP